MLTQSSALPDPSRDTTFSLVEIATRLVAEQGTAALSLRSLGEAASLSPAAVLYHFGNKAALWTAVYDALDHEIAEWYRRQRRLFDDASIGPLPTAAVAAGLACALLKDLGGSLIALTELRHLARKEEIDLGVRLLQTFAREDRFWSEIFGIDGKSASARHFWGCAVRGLMPLLLLEDDGAPRDALIHVLMARVSDRLAARHCAPSALPARTDEPPQATERAKGKQQIVDAAIRVIGHHGVDGLTHRRVAAEAGLSLASTTYHYKTKLDIVIDVLKELQQQGVSSLVSATLSPRRFLPSIVLDENNEPRTAIAALTSLNLAAIRLPSLRGLARQLLRTRGVSALQWLHARGHSDADLFDGIIWSTVGTPAIERALALPAPQRRIYLEEESSKLFNCLFPNRPKKARRT